MTSVHSDTMARGAGGLAVACTGGVYVLHEMRKNSQETAAAELRKYRLFEADRHSEEIPYFSSICAFCFSGEKFEDFFSHVANPANSPLLAISNPRFYEIDRREESTSPDSEQPSPAQFSKDAPG